MQNLLRLSASAGIFLAASAGWAYPGEDRVLSSQALEKYKAGEYQQAEELYRRAAEAAAKNTATAKYNVGTAAYKAGKVEEAEQVFRSVYDQENRYLNAAAGYNLGVIEHRRADPVLEKARKAPSLQEIPPDQLEALKKEIEGGIKQLEKAQHNYRDAILRAPSDREIKLNYEVAARDLDFLRKKLEELQPPPQQDQQQQKDQQDQQQQQDQKKQDQKQQQDQQNQQQQKDEQDQQQQQDQKQQEPQQNQGKQEEKQDQQGQNEPKKDEQEQGEDEKPKDENQKKDGKESEGRKGEQKGQPDQKGEGGDGSGKPSEEPTPGEMSERDVERLLNALPSENSDALQRMLNVRPARQTDMERDW